MIELSIRKRDGGVCLNFIKLFLNLFLRLLNLLTGSWKIVPIRGGFVCVAREAIACIFSVVSFKDL